MVLVFYALPQNHRGPRKYSAQSGSSRTLVMWVCVCVCSRACVRECVYVCVCMCACMCLYVPTQFFSGHYPMTCVFMQWCYTYLTMFNE